MTADPPEPSRTLRKQLGLVDGIALFAGIIVGSGIFVAPAAVAAASPSLAGAVGLWILGGCVAGCGALCYAECGARLPRDGGFFVFYGEAYGPSLAFVAGWAALFVTYSASIAAIAHVFADHVTRIAPAAAPYRLGVGAAVVIAAGILNALGVRLGAWTLRVLTSTKVGVLALLCAGAAVAGGHVDTALAPSTSSATFATLLGAAILVLWTYDGWTDVTLVAGELKHPARDLGRTAVVGMALMVALYVVVQLAVGVLLPADRAAASTQVVAEAVSVGLGARAGAAVAILVIVSTAGSINGIVLAGSRIAYAMGRDGAFPAWFAAVSRFATPARSVTILVAASLVHLAIGKFDDLLALFSFAVWIFYGLTAVALLRLRRRGVGEPLSWRAPGGIVPPLVVLLAGAAMTTSVMRADPRHSCEGLAILLVGFLAYAVWRRLQRRRGGTTL